MLYMLNNALETFNSTAQLLNTLTDVMQRPFWSV